VQLGHLEGTAAVAVGRAAPLDVGGVEVRHVRLRVEMSEPSRRWCSKTA
jgi:hypothetical protein